MASIKDNNMANDIMDALKGKPYFTTTSNLRVHLGLSLGQQAQMRNILDRLWQNDIVARVGNGKHKWRLEYKEWDRWYPFNKPDDDKKESWAGGKGVYSIKYSNSKTVDVPTDDDGVDPDLAEDPNIDPI